MAIKKPIPISFNLDSHNSVQSVCAVIHIDDKNTETLDLSLMQGGEHIAVSPNSTVTARFVRVKNNTLISDDISCTVQENGNIYIPIDNAAAHMLVGEIKIEVNIVDESDVLTMQFPLVIRVNNTILADAEICPISKGTIPELIEKAQETADNAQETADNAQAAASTAQQTANSAQTAANSAQQTADNAIAGLGNKQDTLTAGNNITIEGNVISAEDSGVTDYDELTSRPQINGVTLSGNKTDDDLGVQSKIDNSHKLSSDLVDDTNKTNKFVTSSEKTSWNGKYSKPSGGIPKTDLASAVQTSLGKADSALQSHQDISGKADKSTTLAGYGIADAYTKTQTDTLLNAKESTANKVTAVNSSASDTQYPSAKAVYDFGANILNDIAESVDDALSANSENPVQNKVVNTALNDLRGILMSSQVPVSYTKTDNKYINFNSGMVVSIASAFSYSSPITVNKGDIISIPAETDSDGIARLAKVITQDSLYEGLVNSALTRNSQYYYVVTEDCQVAFCGRTKNLPWFKVYHGIMIKSILDAANNGIINLKKTASTIHPSGGQILYKGDTAVNSGHLVNALAYDNGVIIGARSDGKIVRIGYDGTEETLLSLNGSNMDWRCLFKDSSGNVYASPHATFGSLQMTDRGLYRLSGTTLAWVDLEHPSWETGAIRSAPVGNAIRFNPDASAFRHTFAQVTTGDTVRIRVYTTASTVNIYGAFTDDNNIVISSPTEYFPTDQVAAFRDLPSLTVPTGATRLHIMTFTQSGWESECRIQAYQTIPPASSFVKVISLYDPSSSVQTETEENNDTIWTMCEDDNGNLYAGAYAHTTHANPAIYKSTDGGLTWNYLFNFNSAGLTSNGRHIHSIVYSKWQKALYCIVGEVNTIFKSVDGGESWVNLNVVLNVKGTVMLPTPSGIIIGSDGAYNLFIDVLENDDTTHYNVFTGWANTVFALRLSDITGFVYAFTKIDSAVKDVNYYPPISALTDPSAITTWQNSVPAATFDAWSNYRNSVLSEYPDDAIRPQHYAILVSRNGGGTWEVLRRWKCPSNGAYGFITTGQFLNGECITGLYNELGFVNPIIISEGKHKYISGGCDLDGEIFVRTNASSTVTVL